MNEVAAYIPWLPFDPRDWEQLTPAFGRLRSVVGAHGPKLIANNRAAAFFERCVHKGRLELALVAPDLTYRLFDAVERQKLTICVPLDYEEGCSIKPYYEGDWYARRSDLEKLTEIPVTPVERAETELGTELLGALNPGASPVEPPRRSREKKRSRKKKKRTTRGGVQPKPASRVEMTKSVLPAEPPSNASAADQIAWAYLRLRVDAPEQLRLRGDARRRAVYKRIAPNFTASRSSWTRAMKKVRDYARQQK
jgi:hypothetical protein